MKKFLSDILKEPDGKYSRKSFFMIVAFLIAMLLGLFIVVSDYFLEQEINRYAIDIFDTLLLFSAGISGLSLLDKKTKDKNKEEL